MRNILIYFLMATVEAVMVKDGTNSYAKSSITRGSEILDYTDNIDYSNTGLLQKMPDQTIPVVYTLLLSQPVLASNPESEKQEARTLLAVQQAPTSPSPTDYNIFKGFSPDQNLNSLRTVPRQGYSLGMSGPNIRTVSTVPAVNPLSYTGSDSARPVQQYSESSAVYVTGQGTPANAGTLVASYDPSDSSNAKPEQAIPVAYNSNNPLASTNLKLGYNTQISPATNNKFQYEQKLHLPANQGNQIQGHFPAQYATPSQIIQTSPLVTKGTEYTAQALGQTESAIGNFNANKNIGFNRLLHINNLAPGNTRLVYSPHDYTANRHTTSLSSEFLQNSYNAASAGTNQVNYHAKPPNSYNAASVRTNQVNYHENPPNSYNAASAGTNQVNYHAKPPNSYNAASVRTNQVNYHENPPNSLLGNNFHPIISPPTASITNNLGLGSNPRSAVQVTDASSAIGAVGFTTQGPNISAQNLGLGSNPRSAVQVRDSSSAIGTVRFTTQGPSTSAQNSNIQPVSSGDTRSDTISLTGTGYGSSIHLGTDTRHGTSTIHVNGLDTNAGLVTDKGINVMRMTKMPALAVSKLPVQGKMPQLQFSGVKIRVQPPQNTNLSKQFAFSTSNFVSGIAQTSI